MHLFKSGRTQDAFGNSLGKWYMMSLFSTANDSKEKSTKINVKIFFIRSLIQTILNFSM